MNSDEDPSFPFICEGAAGVLGIFEDTSGVLPDMSTSSEVAELEAAFAKASMPIEAASSESSLLEKAEVEKSSTDDVLSNFEVGNTVLASSDDSKKIDPLVLAGSAQLAQEIQDVLIDTPASLATASSVLGSVGDATKTIQETTASSAVAGTVELAEEIMEAFANSKSVLDTENPVSTDPCNLQEELERLEQLAVERVREIEGELVSSAKQITECNLNLDAPKATKVNDTSDDLQKEFIAETVITSETTVLGGAVVSDEQSNVNESNDTVDVNLTSTSTSSDVCAVADDKIANSVLGEERQIVLLDVQSSESVKASLLTEKVCETDALKLKQSEILTKDPELGVSNLQQGAKTNCKTTEAETHKDVQEVSKKDSNLGVGSVDKSDNAAKTQVGKNEHVVEKSKEMEVVSDVQSTQKVSIGSEHLGSENKIDNTSSDHGPQKSTLSAIEESGASADVETESETKDIQNYETEDDDLEVLEAFIVKSATNPELAVCSVQATKDVNTSKYSLESALIDDLTKTDNGNGSNGTETTSEAAKETAVVSDSTAGPSDAQVRLSKALEKAASQMAKSLNSSDAVLRQRGRPPKKRAGDLVSGKELPLKKRLSQRPTEIVEIGGIQALPSTSGMSRDESGSKTEKTVVTVEVKRRRGRPVGSGKKSLMFKGLAVVSGSNDSKQKASERLLNEENYEMAATSKQIARESVSPTPNARKSLRNVSKKLNSEDVVLSTSAAFVKKKVTRVSNQPSGEGRSQKKQPEDNTQNSAAASKIMLKRKESRAKESLKATDGILDSAAEEGEKDEDHSESSADIEIIAENKLPRSASVEEIVGTEINIKDKKQVSPASDLKTRKNDDRKRKESSSIGINKKASSDIRDKTSPTSNSRPTRSTKQKDKISPSPKLSNKEKDKENLEKLTRESTGEARRSIQNTSLTVKGVKSHDSQRQKVQSSQLERLRTVKRKAEKNMDASPTKMKRIELVQECPKVRLECPKVRRFEKLKKSCDEKDLTDYVPESDTYSERLLYQFEDITFDMLKNQAKQLTLPTPLWGAQVSIEKDLVVFSRLRTDPFDDKHLIDKAIVFQGSLRPVVLINNEPVDLPVPCIRTFEDVVVLIRNFHTVSFCEGTGVKQRPLSRHCFRYLDVANPGRRCSQCLEERRRVLFVCARKLRERLRVMREARCHQ